MHLFNFSFWQNDDKNSEDIATSDPIAGVNARTPKDFQVRLINFRHEFVLFKCKSSSIHLALVFICKDVFFSNGYNTRVKTNKRSRSPCITVPVKMKGFVEWSVS